MTDTIPTDWEIKTLDECAEIISSPVDKKSRPNEKVVKLCNYMDVYSNRQINKSLEFMEATAKDREIERFQLFKDDLVVTKDSEDPTDIGVPALVVEDIEDLVCGYHLAIVRTSKKVINPDFCLYLFLHESVQKQFFLAANGSTRFGLGVGELQRTLVPVPPLVEQEKIADILTSLDDQIESVESKLVQLESLKKSLMGDLLTGRVRVSVD